MKKKPPRFKDLTEAQQDFIQSNAIERELTISEWLHFLTPACAYDEARAKYQGPIKFCLFALFVLLFVLTVVIFLKYGSDFPFLLFGPFVFLLFSIHKFKPISKMVLEHKTLDNNIRLFLVPLLLALSLEIGHNKNIYLKINFKRSLKDKKENRTKTDRARQPNVKSQTYIFDTLELRTEFPDRTQLHIRIIDTVQKRIRRGRKNKVKIKIKMTRRTLFRLKFNKKSYRANPELAMPDDIRARFQTTDKHLKYSRILKQKTLGTAMTLSTDAMINALAEPYPYLTPKEKAQ